MIESEPRRHSPDHFITAENKDGVEAISLPNVITRIAPGAERILGPCKVGESYAPLKFVIPLEGAYSVRGDDENQKLRSADKALLRMRAGRHTHVDLTLTRPPEFATEYAPGTLKYGIDAVRNITSKGAGLSALFDDEPEGKVEPEFWRFNPRLADDAEASVRGLCSENEALDDWWLSDKLNKRGGRFGIPLLLTRIAQLPARRNQVEQEYKGNYQVKLYPVAELQRSSYESSVSDAPILPDFSPDERHLDTMDDDKRETGTFGVPVYYERGLVSGIRVGDLGHSPDILQARLREIIRVIGREDASVVDERSYLIWFAKQLAKNIALLHSEGLVQTQLNHQFMNITLAAEIVDNSAARKLHDNPFREFTHDIDQAHGWQKSHGRRRGAIGALIELMVECRKITKESLPDVQELEEIFLDEYTRHLEEYYAQLDPIPKEIPSWLTFARNLKDW